jgi:protein-S-isoprenylcysteine O-methyltransferase Ste14
MVAPLHFKSVEHIKLRKKYGKEKGLKIGRIYGIISGIVESIILIGLWVSPQPRYLPPPFSSLTISIGDLSISPLRLAVSLPLTAVGAWFGIDGVRGTGMEVAETHCTPDEIVTDGAYSIVRHPQYFGWILAHVGISVLLSAWYSTLFTPILVAFVYLISRKEEYELIREFGEEYEDYQRKVPMLIPKWKRPPEDKTT